MKTRFFSRITLFLLTNLAVVFTIGVITRVLGLDVALARRGLDYGALLAFSAVVGFSGSIISLLLSKVMAKWSTGAEVITNPRTQDELWLLQTVERLAQKAGIQMPEVAIYDSPEVNAFATGPTRNSALVAVSSGLLRNMSQTEVEAVLAHEVAHAANGDMITMTLLQGVLNTFVVFLSRVGGYAVDAMTSRRDDEERSSGGIGSFVVTIVLQLLLGVVASMIVSAYSRRREYRADHGAAELVGPAAMIAALARLKRQEDGPTVLPDSMRAFGIRSARTKGFLDLFRSHPHLDDRIEALRGFRAEA
jgi:heat shock protein HtpX